ncbi:MAG: glycoside hydrolase family 3 protein, partial [Gammaproteobacteria bacterium]|nr:glycoside hydrolase family 3 protein [Gammaproteobacteria bacterium]
VTAAEILATGVDWSFAPTLAVARNVNWGRSYESYSQDPDIVKSYAGAFVRGLQGDLGDQSVMACAKHWVGEGGTRHGIDQGETSLPADELERVHMTPYCAAIEAGVLTIMVSYSSWNGAKCHGNQFLVTDVLKNKMRFDGFIVSDWDGIHSLSEDLYKAVGIGVNAGIDMFMEPDNWRDLIEYLKAHIEFGTVKRSRIDDAVRRILSVKFAYGLFDKARPAARPSANHESFGGLEHRELAREAVRKSLVLLKNDGGILPLDRSSRILVAGKNADNRGHQCGGFTLDWQGTSGNAPVRGGTSIWEGIHAVAPNAVFSGTAGKDADPVQHDVAIVVIGELPYAEGPGDIRSGNDVIVEAGSQISGLLTVLEPYSHTLELAKSHPEDLQTIRNITSCGIPVIAILISGRPLVVNQELAEVAGFIAAWLPGSEGQGVADVLFGDYDFTGKLAFSWPADSEANCQVDDPGYAPLFSCGYGLKY